MPGQISGFPKRPPNLRNPESGKQINSGKVNILLCNLGKYEQNESSDYKNAKYRADRCSTETTRSFFEIIHETVNKPGWCEKLCK